MKAIIITKPGGPEVLELKEVPVPRCGPDEVLIRVQAAGINRPDVFQRKGNYPPPTGIPGDIPGLEVAGLVAEVGSSVERWKEGDAVCALLGGGGYAEFVVAHEDHCLAIPPGLTLIQAASLPETVFTVWHNVFERAQLQPREKFLVHGGTSGIGITAIQLAKFYQCSVFTTAGSQIKIDECLRFGADIAINYNKEDFETRLREFGVDVVLDMVGGDYIAKNLRLLNTDGRLVFINCMRGAEGAFDAADLMRRRITITGSTLRPRTAHFKGLLARRVEERVWPMLESGDFKPVVYRTFPLDSASLAHRLMESGEHIGKIVLVIS